MSRTFTALATVALTLGLSREAAAQETIYNVVLGKPVPRGELFTTSQLTLDGQQGMTDTYVVYGLGLDADVGVSLINLDLARSVRGRPKVETVAHPGDDPLAPVAALTLFKRLELHDVIGVGVSTQTGVGLAGPGHLSTLDSADVTLRWPHHDYRLIGGVYYGNQGRLGEHAGWGYWAGAELALVDRKIHLEAEFISGHHALSNVIVGPKLFFTDDTDLAIGVSLPAPGSGNPQAFVLQLEVEDLLGKKR
jgi:hypothetical protein